MAEMLVLSVRQPWPWAMFYAGKDIENRDWSTRVRGRVLIHASKGMTRDEYEDVRVFVAALSRVGQIAIPSCAFPAFGDLERGGIVGSVDIVDCVRRSSSPWFFGRFGFVLRDPRPLPFMPCRGQLGFFRVPYSEV